MSFSFFYGCPLLQLPPMMNPTPPTETPVTRDLHRRGVPHRLFHHSGPVHSLEQAAEERGQRPHQVVRSILFRLAAGQFVMVLAAGPDQISWPTLRQHLGVSRISMASEEEVLAQTGYVRGTVSPFGLPEPADPAQGMRILIDESIFQEDEISLGSGVRNTTVILRAADLRRALPQAEIDCFVNC
jgi:prolyl-tRNA editing enzyme YbaK/EbsC (Cys-tRNA(Pro) deacylase)